MIFICISVYNRVELTIKCLESIYRQKFNDFKIIICDDGSSDGTCDIIRERYSEVIVLKGNGNLWWAGGTNQCIQKALQMSNSDNDYIFTLNNDTELTDGLLEKIYNLSKEYKNYIIGCVNCLYNEPECIEPSAFNKKKIFFLNNVYERVNSFKENLKRYHGIIEVDSLSGKGVLIPIRVFKEIGLYNKEKLPQYHADTEFTIRAKKNGYNLLLNYDTVILSHNEQTGIGTINSNANFIELIKSFFTLRSANHLKSLYNFSRLVYKKNYLLYFFLSIMRIFGGFIKRKLKKN